MTDRPTYIDLSHTVEHGMVTYPGLPVPAVGDHLSRDDAERRYAPGVRFHIGRIEMIANTGTYIDAPFHRYEDGADIAGLTLDVVAGLHGVVVRVAQRGDRAIGPEVFASLEVEGRAVLVHTGWDRYWRTDGYARGFPFLTADAAAHLVERGARLVGIDSVNIDDDTDPPRPVHSQLLAAGIPVVEHLCNLGALPDSGFQFYAVPARVVGMGSFPVRAFGVVGRT